MGRFQQFLTINYFFKNSHHICLQGLWYWFCHFPYGLNLNSRSWLSYLWSFHVDIQCRYIYIYIYILLLVPMYFRLSSFIRIYFRMCTVLKLKYTILYSADKVGSPCRSFRFLIITLIKFLIANLVMQSSIHVSILFKISSEQLTLRKKSPYLELFWSAFFPLSDWIRGNAGKMRTRITPNTDTFYAV